MKITIVANINLYNILYLAYYLVILVLNYLLKLYT